MDRLAVLRLCCFSLPDFLDFGQDGFWFQSITHGHKLLRHVIGR
uniref:Uncharacterized protein n=1 Tax=Rhizophora mucronata TaxID=61149 RepID=A0A2P2NQN0_RHIMU